MNIDGIYSHHKKYTKSLFKKFIYVQGQDNSDST